MHIASREQPPKNMWPIRVYDEELRHPDGSVPVILPKGADLRRRGPEPRYAHVVQSGLVATCVTLVDGRSMAVRMDSAGEVLELEQLLGCDYRECVSTVLMAGVALRLPFEALRAALETDTQLRRSMFRSLGRRLQQLEQISVCNRMHHLEQRLSGHLINLQDRTGYEILPLTQEQLAQHMGVQRSTVVMAAGELRQRGYIDFRRGSIVIRNRPGLESAACECHRTPATSVDRAS